MKKKKRHVTKREVSVLLTPRAGEDKKLTGVEEEILKFWNSKGIVRHKPTLKFLKSSISRAIDEYDTMYILMAIHNYATMLFSDYPYMTHTWKLPDFLSLHNALPDFMPDGVKWKNYLKWKEKQKIKQEAEPDPQQEPVCHIEEDIYQKYMKWLNSLPYNEYLQTEHWQHFRREALKDAQHRCRVCNAAGVELNVHHNNYSNRGRETFNDVVVLCKTCHEKFHAPGEIGTPINHAKIDSKYSIVSLRG